MFSARTSKEFKQQFLKIIEEKKIDAIHCEYTAMAQYIWIKKMYPNIIFNIVEHDVTRQSFYRKSMDSKGLKQLFWKWQLNLATTLRPGNPLHSLHELEGKTGAQRGRICS